MSLLTLLGPQPPSLFAESFGNEDASHWSQNWSTEGDNTPTSWTFPTATLSPWTVGPAFTSSFTTTNTHSPNNAVVLTRNTATAGNGYIVNASGVLTAGAGHAFSVWVYASASTVYTLSVAPKTSGNVGVGPRISQDFIPPANKWYRATLYFDTPATATNADMYLTDDKNLSPTLNSTLIVDDFKLATFFGYERQYYGNGWLRSPAVALGVMRMDLVNGPSIGDTEVYVKIRPNGWGNTQHGVIGINGNATGNDWFSTSGYALYVRYNGGIFDAVELTLWGMIGGNKTQIGSTVSVPANPDAGQFSVVRLQRIGTTLRARLWDENFAEPSTWQVSGTITGTPATGIVSLAGTADGLGNDHELFYDDLVISVPTGPAVPTYVSGSIAGSINGGATALSFTVSVPKPANVAIGNMLIAFVSNARTNPSNRTYFAEAPSGWTLQDSIVTTADGTMSVWTKIAEPGEPSTYAFGYTITSGAADTWFLDVAILQYTPCVFDRHAMNSSNGTASTNYVAPSVTTENASGVVISAWSLISAAAAVGTPAGMTSRQSNLTVSDFSMNVVDKAYGAAGTVGTFTATGSSDKYASATVTLAPAGTNVQRGNVKVYNGIGWAAKPAKVWNGIAWVTKPAKTWKNVGWVATDY